MLFEDGHLLALAKQKGLKGVSHLRKAELVTKLTEAMPVHSPLISRPDPAPTGPDAQVGGHGEPSVGATRSARAPAVAEQAGGSGAAQSVNEVQQAAMDAKFFLGPDDQSPPPPAPELPATYNDNRLVLLARDPYWLYAYWDFSVEQIGAALTRLGVQDARPILRVFDVTYVHFDGTNAWSAVDIELTPFATNSVTLKLPSGCGGDVSWCTVAVSGSTNRYAVYRQSGTTCSSSGIKYADYLTTPNVFPAFAHASGCGCLASLQLDFPVSLKGSTIDQYELTDTIYLRNSTRI